MKKVFIVEPNQQYIAMYIEEGYELAESVEESDLIQFTGGADVTPELYGCGQHPQTQNSVARDDAEEAIYNKASALRKPMVGICRGGQFLNVMCGGKMYQHVDGHAIHGTHYAYDKQSGASFKVTSTHHQMMIPGGLGVVTTHVPQSRCSHKDYVDADGEIQVVIPNDNPDEDDADVEAVYYPQHRCLCFQPHPEYEAGRDCREYFFAQVDAHLFQDWKRLTALTGYNPYGDEDEYDEDLEEIE